MAEKDLEALEILSPADDEVESQPDVIEKRLKKPRTQKQIDAFAAVRAKRDENRKGRAEVRAVDAEIRVKVVEEKIVKKALAIKKKQILRDAEIDAISDTDDIPIEVVKKIMTKYKRKPTAPLLASVRVAPSAPEPERASYTFI